MDPFDEFEFKPLTDGLGFHKKTMSLKDGMKAAGVVESEMQPLPSSLPEDLPSPTKTHTFEDVLSALEKSPLKRPTSDAVADLNFTEPLPREAKARKAMEVEIPRPVQSPFPQPEAYRAPTAPVVPRPTPSVKKVPAKDDLASIGTRRGAADSPQRRLLAPATLSLPSALLDFVIVLALSIVFLVALLTVTKVDLGVVMKNLNSDLMTQLSLAIMFIAVMQMYVVIARSFFGRTLGEWTFDLQVGQDGDQVKESYPLRVALRSFLVTSTGLIFLPLISALIRRDIAGSICGVKLYRQKI
jgi:hypothetical protein